MSKALKLIAVVLALSGLGAPSFAQTEGFSGLARIDPAFSRIEDRGTDDASIVLSLSQGVPYRLFTLTDPPRLVLDFQEVDWRGLTPETLLQGQLVTQAQFGTYVPGWSRMVLEMAEPLKVQSAALDINAVTAQAELKLELTKVSAEVFADNAGAPTDPRWDLPAAEVLPAPVIRGDDVPMLVVLDPGHGGIDPGAEVKGEGGAVVEKDLILGFAIELGDVLVRSGRFQVQLTRDGDYFVSLERRIALAHQAGADLFVSLHADALSEGLAHGATVHVLSPEASDVASAKLAERHDRSDLLAGVDLSDADDRVTGILLDLARQETQPRSDALAQALVDGMSGQGGPMNRRPLRSAGFSVLKAADIPSVLIEIGFMSSPRDLENLQNPEWRAKMARGILNGLVAWREEDAARRVLVRQ
ncbi:N-acetylmuramoyl-L-alanine amidase [Sedimentitalea sp. CY04]|uniref:N-acetylmuramoyl-L-alanine amidase n=1 Tax=Parasedimentitalea denitrificans TaxID=2211118 RepID=A0ABX0WB47_9RHOB|nr:N-acetylmuramoyl-L-alanine amidase [Sedimentitalea sp. CY04]NIZ62889.1 N-acetylmuramoyl-L-alanine amidase [Sedimentitalea sp. CY04]